MNTEGGESSGETLRFKLFNDDELEGFIKSASSDNTKKQIKYSLAIFNEYCKLADVQYDQLDNPGKVSTFIKFLSTNQ